MRGLVKGTSIYCCHIRGWSCLGRQAHSYLLSKQGGGEGGSPDFTAEKTAERQRKTSLGLLAKGAAFCATRFPIVCVWSQTSCTYSYIYIYIY